MLSARTHIIFFISSYAPLLVVFAILDTFENLVSRWVCSMVALISVGVLPWLLRGARDLHPIPIEVSRAGPRNSDTVGYVVTYLLPFIVIDSGNWPERVALFVFFAVIAVLFVRAQLFFINPVLNLAGFRIFEVETPRRTVVLLTKRSFLASSDNIRAHRLTNDVYLEATDD